MLRRCTCCKRRRRARSFSPGKAACRECRAAATREWSQRNKERIREQRQQYYQENKRRIKRKVRDDRQRRLASLNELKQVPCADCGKIRDPVCMDFDHVRGRKYADVSRLAAVGSKALNKEISKTQLICANCHRTRSQQRRGGPKEYPATQLGVVIDALKNAPCVGCGGLYPPECMDFDHVNPTYKKFSVAAVRRNSVTHLPALLAEVAKCRLLCACCHRLKTHGPRGVVHDPR